MAFGLPFPTGADRNNAGASELLVTASSINGGVSGQMSRSCTQARPGTSGARCCIIVLGCRLGCARILYRQISKPCTLLALSQTGPCLQAPDQLHKQTRPPS